MKIGDLKVYGIIYKIENLINGKVYIGQTIRGFDKRYKGYGKAIEKVYSYHYKLFKNKNKSVNMHLLNAIEKYGFESFSICEIHDVAFSKDELDIKEKTYIKLFNSFYNGYNRNDDGEGNIGHKHNEKTKIKISKAGIGRIVSKETRVKMSLNHGKSRHWVGRKHKKETIIKMKQSWDDERKQIFSQNHCGENNNNSKKVIIYNSNKEKILEFDTKNEASEWLVKNNVCKTVGTAKDIITDKSQNGKIYKSKYYFQMYKAKIEV